MSRLSFVQTHVLQRRGERLASLHERVTQEAHKLDRTIEMILSEQASKRLSAFIQAPPVVTMIEQLEDRMQEIDSELFDRHCAEQDGVAVQIVRAA